LEQQLWECIGSRGRRCAAHLGGHWKPSVLSWMLGSRRRSQWYTAFSPVYNAQADAALRKWWTAGWSPTRGPGEFSMQLSLLQKVVAISRAPPHPHQRPVAREGEWNFDARWPQSPHFAKQIGEGGRSIARDLQHQIARPHAGSLRRAAVGQTA